jgi:catechol 2,3-dioxygenase-like lactoylglutathione lyase family enzyme
MLNHVSVGVRDVNRSRRFYDAALRPLGLVRIVDFGEGRGSDCGAAPAQFGVEFTITREGEVKTPIPGAHLCFRPPDRAAVDAFHRPRSPPASSICRSRPRARNILTG